MASIVINIDPILVQFGPLAVRWYGLMYAVGIGTGLYFALPYAKQRRLDEEKIWTVFWWGVIGGLVGARLYYVAQSDLGMYLTQPWRILAIWEGGMAFYGAVVATTAMLALACRRVKLPFWILMDAVAILGAIGQGFGRIGNIINGDIVGYPTNLPWGVIYTNPNSFVADHTVAYLPAAFYELIFNIILFAVIWSLRNRLHRPGALFVTYVALYSFGQFVLFFWRDNQVLLWGLKNAQLTALVVPVVMLLAWWLTTRRSKHEASARLV